MHAISITSAISIPSELAYRNSSQLSFGQAILFKRDKFYAQEKIKRWLSDTPECISDTWAEKKSGTTGFGYVVLGVKFIPVAEGKIVKGAKPFWVFNVHYGLEEDLKTKSCHKMVEIIDDVAGDLPFIIAGDFNFFPDRDGDKQRSILTEHFKDLGKGAKTFLGNRHVEGTFVGYEHDAFKADLKNMVSRLDHVFGSKSVNTKGHVILYAKTMLQNEPDEFTTRSYPSDHIPLFTTILIQC